MGFSTRTSLKREYEEFIEREVEEYKERVARSMLLKIADEAVERLHEAEQVTLSEIVLRDEVDRIIASRLRLPKYRTWLRRQRKDGAPLRHPDVWGLSPDAPVVQNLPTRHDAHVLVARPSHGRTALFLAANGCTVTAVEPDADIVQRVLDEAARHGLASRVHPLVTDLGRWSPDDAPLTAVVCTPAAFAGLSLEERTRVLGVLQSATHDGGVHLVETLAAAAQPLDLDELTASYALWEITIVPNGVGPPRAFVARKG